MKNNNIPQPALPFEIEQRMVKYYTQYYRDSLGIPKWKQHVEARLSEESNAHRLIAKFRTWFEEYNIEEKRVLVVGGGTGAEFIAFSQLGTEVYAIEPNLQAVQIARQKADMMGFCSKHFMQGCGEQLSFSLDTFDLVWCFTVLEHVQDVQMCISEMIRVTKPLGRIFIMTPDYRQFYEPHYKITMPLMAPRWFLRLWLLLRRRPVEFLDTLQFVNSKQLAKVFQEYPVMAFRVIHPWPANWQHDLTFQQRLIVWLTKTMEIQRDQYWVLQKLNHQP